MNLAKVKCVAGFEFWSTVKRKGYLIATLGMPLFVLAYGGVISLIGKTMADEESKIRMFGVVDGPGLLALGESDVAAPDQLPAEIRAALERMPNAGARSAVSLFQRTTYRGFDDVETALESLRAQDISGIFVLPESFLDDGKIEQYRSASFSSGMGDARRALESMIKNRLLEGKLEGSLLERVKDPIRESESWTLGEDGEVEPYNVAGRVAKIAVPIVFMVLLFISLMMSAGYLLQGTATEKENKVVEVLLASAEPQEILTGKLLGLGAAGLLQVLVWFGMAIAGAFIAAAAFSIVGGIPIPWGAIALGAVLFVLAYMFVGSLMLGTGSLGSNMREAQQYSMAWTMLCVLPLMFLGAIMTQPSGTIAKVLTWIPFSSPTMLVFRSAVEPDKLAWWELVGASSLLVISTIVALRLGGRLFRVGLLLGGSKPGIREILRQARLSGG